MLKNFWTICRRLLWLVFALILILFAINNRQPIVLSVEPLGFMPPMPAYLLLFLGIFIGVVAAAGVTGWLRLQGFAKRRKAERRTDYLEGQVSALAEDAHQHRAAKAHTTASDDNESTELAAKK